MTEQTSLSIIDLYATNRHMQRDDLVVALTKTIMPKEAGKADMIAFLQIAHRFDLDPWAREIFCIMSKGRVQPYISVDGYAKIANREASYDGCEFDYEQDSDGRFLSVTCSIWRKDRARPTRVTEFMSECYRPDSEAWKRNPARMLRHRAFVQCVRIAFGITGALDEDNAEIIDVTPDRMDEPEAPKPAPPKAPPSTKKPPSPKGKPEPEPEQKPEPEPDERAMVNEPEAEEKPDLEAFLNDLNDRLNEAKDVEQLRQIWVDMNPAKEIMPNEHMMRYAQGIFDKLEAKLKAK